MKNPLHLVYPIRTKYAALSVLLSALLFSSCNLKITTELAKTYPTLDYREDVLVLGLGEQEPENAEFLGEVKIGDSGLTTKCDYNLIIDYAKLEARKIGGNAIQITKHIPPSDFGSTCHSITANILKITDIEAFLNHENTPKEQPAFDYALLHIYRNTAYGALVTYNLHLNDSVICRVKPRWKTTVKVDKPDTYTLWAKTEVRKEVTLLLEPGKEYYIKCGVNMGAFVGRPSIDIVENGYGKKEFTSIKQKTAATKKALP